MMRDIHRGIGQYGIGIFEHRLPTQGTTLGVGSSPMLPIPPHTPSVASGFIGGIVMNGTRNEDWFGTSETGHLEALKVESGQSIQLTISKIEVSCAGIFRQMDYNIPSNEKWTIPAKDKLMVLTTIENGDVLVYQKSAINSIGGLLSTGPTQVSNGFSIPTAEANRPDHVSHAEWVMENNMNVVITRGEGRYGIYTATLGGGI